MQTHQLICGSIVIAGLSAFGMLWLRGHQRQRKERDIAKKEMSLLRYEIVEEIHAILRKIDLRPAYLSIAELEASSDFFLEWEDGLYATEGKRYSVVQPLWNLLRWTVIRGNPILKTQALRVEETTKPEDTTSALIERLCKQDISGSALIWIRRDLNKATLSFYPEIAGKMTAYRQFEMMLER